MEVPGCPRRRRPARMIGWMLIASALVCHSQPVAISPRWQVTFPPVANGRASVATAVPVNGDSILVSVVAAGCNAANPAMSLGNNPVATKVIGYDPVSRLGFYKVNGNIPLKPTEWLEETGGSIGSPLHALAPSGTVKCRCTGWVKQVGGKILPLALLRVAFEQAVPPPGTPLCDEAGRVVAIVFQESGNGNTGYAIPSEAVHRVRRDVGSGGPLVRGWLGLSLRAENQSPQVVRVIANSPAASAGILPADVLLSVGTRQITDYADAANAFFYLVPGQAVRVKLLRGVEQLEFTLTPTRPAE